MIKKIAVFIVRFLSIFIILASCACAPKSVKKIVKQLCGKHENINKVVSIDFTGPNIIPPKNPNALRKGRAEYKFTVTVEKKDINKSDRICVLIMDNDGLFGWKSLLWDDILDVRIMTIKKGENQGKGDFVLIAENDDDICGDKGLLEYKFFLDNSGEDKAEIYIRALLYGSSKGKSSPIHDVKIAK